MIADVKGEVEWKYQDLKQQGETLCSRILKSFPESMSSQSDIASSSAAQKQSLVTSRDEDVVPSQSVANDEEQAVLTSPVKAQESKTISSDKDVSPPQSTALQLEVLLTSLVKAQDWNTVREKLKTIEDMTILHMMDCGGHPECLEILPLLLEGRGLSLIFLNLTHDLDKTYQVAFQGKEGASSIQYESVFTAREVFQRILCTISSLQSDAPNEKPVALLVGSYLDKTNREAVLMLDNSVQEALKSFIEKDILFPANVQEGKYIVALNNMSEDQGDIEELRRVILTIIKTRLQQEPIPTAWLLIHLLLRIKFEEDPGWCSVEECVKVAAACGIEGKELLGENGILCYIHKHYGTLLYYPKVPGLRDRVICDPNIILHVFTQTCLFSFACNPGYFQTAMLIRTTGEIPNDLMETICATKSSRPIPVHEIVALLKDRYILYESVRTAKCMKSYFMPCLLHPDLTVVKEASNPSTLSDLNPAPLQLIPHSTGYVPLGLFPAMVVKLSHTWALKSGKRFRNKIQFKVRQKDMPTRTVEFCQHHSYLELRLLHKKAPQVMDLSVLTICRQQLWKALHEVSSKYPHMKDVIWRFGFYCPRSLQQGGQPHSSVCQTEDLPPVDMECFHESCSEEEDFLLEDKHKSWFQVS